MQAYLEHHSTSTTSNTIKYMIVSTFSFWFAYGSIKINNHVFRHLGEINKYMHAQIEKGGLWAVYYLEQKGDGYSCKYSQSHLFLHSGRGKNITVQQKQYHLYIWSKQTIHLSKEWKEKELNIWNLITRSHEQISNAPIQIKKLKKIIR